ncbi:MAG TPA: acetylxylan esterase [Bryobacteraceae bacterium]|nr:acetylxylan esterase [Bryobacteraceae bacterium]
MSRLAGCVLTLVWSFAAGAQTWKGNHDESAVKSYSLPDALTLQNGKKVRTAEEWTKARRPEIVRLFEENVHGRTPATKIAPKFEVTSTDEKALQGTAIRKLVTISFPSHANSPKINMVVYLPAAAKAPVPVFVSLSFGGIHTIDADPGLPLAEVWVRDTAAPAAQSSERVGQVRKQALPESRGQGAGRWVVGRILERGYGLAVAYYGDIEPDFNGGLKHGVRAMFLAKGEVEPAANQWGAIGAWAWGMSRMADYLVTDQQVDSKRLAVIGHSRLGKAALWAGAQDDRFGIVISNNSGEGGAALSKRNFGEDVWRLNNNFPHWFAKSYRQWSNKEAEMPFDHHMLLALIAPRPLYVASATEDLHSDPRGEFLSAVHAGAVYQLFGKQGLGTDEMPAPEKPIMKSVGYHLRTGKHDVTAYDWDRYCDFADSHWKKQ